MKVRSYTNQVALTSASLLTSSPLAYRFPGDDVDLRDVLSRLEKGAEMYRVKSAPKGTVQRFNKARENLRVAIKSEDVRRASASVNVPKFLG